MKTAKNRKKPFYRKKRKKACKRERTRTNASKGKNQKHLVFFGNTRCCMLRVCLPHQHEANQTFGVKVLSRRLNGIIHTNTLVLTYIDMRYTIYKMIYAGQQQKWKRNQKKKLKQHLKPQTKTLVLAKKNVNACEKTAVKTNSFLY